MRKLRFLSLLLLAALLVAGVSYAAWSESIVVNGTVNTGEVDWYINGVLAQLDNSPDWTCDENFENIHQLDKDVGSTTVELVDTDGDGDNDTAVVTVNNAYPGYYNYLSFMVKNNGTIPLKVEDMIVTNPNPEALKLDWADDSGATLMPGRSRSLTVWFLVREGAEENSTYTFTMEAPAVQWNMYNGD